MKHRGWRSFASYVNQTDFECCWLWVGPLDQDGYALFNGDRAARIAFRYAYGSIPEGKIVHHICLNKLCVNARHLVAVSPHNHPDDGAAINRNKKFCVRGHEFTYENTLIIIRLRDFRWCKERQCRECNRLRKGHKFKRRTLN